MKIFPYLVFFGLTLPFGLEAQDASKPATESTTPAVVTAQPQAAEPAAAAKTAPAAAEEAQAGAELRGLRKQVAKGVAVPAETLAAAHERFLVARYAANRERMKSAAAAHRTDPEVGKLRRALAAAPDAETRQALLARHVAVSQALESEKNASAPQAAETQPKN